MSDLSFACSYIKGDFKFSRKVEGILSAHDDRLSFKSAELNFDVPLSLIKRTISGDEQIVVWFKEKIQGRKAVTFQHSDSLIGTPRNMMGDLVKGILTLGIAGSKGRQLIDHNSWRAYFKEKGVEVTMLDQAKPTD